MDKNRIIKLAQSAQDHTITMDDLDAKDFNGKTECFNMDVLKILS